MLHNARAARSAGHAFSVAESKRALCPPAQWVIRGWCALPWGSEGLPGVEYGGAAGHKTPAVSASPQGRGARKASIPCRHPLHVHVYAWPCLGTTTVFSQT